MALINLSDDSEEEGAEEDDQLTPFSPTMWGSRGGTMGPNNPRRLSAAPYLVSVHIKIWDTSSLNWATFGSVLNRCHLNVV